MTLHKEGYATIAIAIIIFLVVASLSYLLFGLTWPTVALSTIVGIVTILVVSFFRTPNRKITKHADAIIAPADGTVVAIEEVDEPEILNTRCLQVSIFMSVFNVHINWFPISGTILKSLHHDGNFKAAWLPKSSTQNERSSILIKRENGQLILVRQVAGALARRIVTYANEGEKAEQSSQLGFIKFGSRVDLYLPLGTQIDVSLKDKVVGSQTIIGWLK
ncbi:MAG: phosphatidylserine decarboxylase family protein [Marinilabiliaceae bacterium]|nr:phosphatidylserine decarboxylase family protein [Marinilabiliaceae bacterium]